VIGSPFQGFATWQGTGSHVIPTKDCLRHGNQQSDVVNLWLRFIVFNSISKLQRPNNKVPNEETEELADEEQEHSSQGLGFEKAEGEGENVADERHPSEQGEPDAIAVDFLLLTLHGLRTHLEPPLNPFPTTDAPDPIDGDASEPVAQGADDEAADRVVRGHKHSHIQRVGAERHDGCRQEGAQKQAQETETFKPGHL
jgi:hypothetical protein